MAIPVVLHIVSGSRRSVNDVSGKCRGVPVAIMQIRDRRSCSSRRDRGLPASSPPNWRSLFAGWQKSYDPLVFSTPSPPSSLLELLQVVRSGQEVEPMKSELDVYLDEGLFISQDYKFDALAWWKEKSMKFRILSKLATNVLAVPITTVASEATLSAGGRVIDPYRSSLAPEIVQMLICTCDWCRSLHGVKRKNKVRTTC